MNILTIILIAIAGIITLMLIMGLFMRKEHYVKREIIIHAPRQKVYDYVKLLKNQDKFNKNAMADPNRNGEYKGTDGTVGFIYAWSGNKDAGEGEKEILGLVEGESVETEIRFVKPMKVSARIVMEMQSLPDGETKLTWSNSGILKYPVSILIPMMEKSVAKDMDSSLLTLKNILEG